MQRILRAFTSLSTRLLLLTLLWVSFIVVSVGYTMLLNWELEASAATVRTVGELRHHAYRLLVSTPTDAAFSRTTTLRAPICAAKSTLSTSR